MLTRQTRTTYADTSFTLETYDALGRVIRKTNQSGITTNYAYEANGNRTQATNAHGTTTWTYDSQLPGVRKQPRRHHARLQLRQRRQPDNCLSLSILPTARKNRCS